MVVIVLIPRTPRRRTTSYWGAFKEQFPQIANVTKNLNIANWDVESIKETAKKMRELLTVDMQIKIPV